MFEVSGENLIGKSGYILDDEGAPVFRPADDVLVLCILNEKERTSMMRYVLARKMGMVFKISSRLRYYEDLIIIYLIMHPERRFCIM
jgi:hypothetical protein